MPVSLFHPSKTPADIFHLCYTACMDSCLVCRRAPRYHVEPAKAIDYESLYVCKSCQTAAKAEGKKRFIERGVMRMKLYARQEAYRAVRAAKKRGCLAPASVCSFEWCQNAVSLHGHHYLGYAPAHQLDLQWLCAHHHRHLHAHQELNPIFHARVQT